MDKKDKEYQELTNLFNSQNKNITIPLVEYLNLSEDEYIEQLEIILNTSRLKDKKDDYVITVDNYLKMILN